jgi:AcrR family transcriptional regulator
MPRQLERTTPRRVPKKRRTTGIPESRRRAIVDEAVRLMEEKGFAAVSIQHVADALAFSKANFYHHIESKEKLLYEIFLDTLQSSHARIAEIASGPEPLPDKLRALIAFYVSLMTERRAVMLVWFRERAHLTAEHQAEVSRIEQQLTATLRELYARGMDEGYLKRMDPDLVRQAVFGMCFMLTRRPQPFDRASVNELTRQLQEIATAGLLTRS